MVLFVGLGNPGPTYVHNRHNIGYRVVDRLVEETNARTIGNRSFHGELYRHNDLLFLKPTTYMNLSGRSVAAVARFYKIPVERIVVIHDDIDLPFGDIRIKRGGGHGGHNGLRSIDAELGTSGYVRIRMGVGKPPYKSQVADYVLSDFSPEEAAKVGCLVDYATRVALRIPRMELEEIRSRYRLKASDDPCAR
ncbi:aminoacyl-tRNA hydrolase [Nitratifractor sp.]